LLGTLQAIGGVVAVITLFLYLIELRELRHQIAENRIQSQEDRRLSQAQFEEIRAQSRGQNAFGLVEYLEDPRHLQVRAVVDRILTKSYDAWTSEDHSSADMVWRMWNVSCVFQSLQALPDDFMARFYGGSLVRHWHILKPFVEQLRGEFGRHRARDWEALVHRLEAEQPELIPRWAAASSE
jgi:hypothetical protein